MLPLSLLARGKAHVQYRKIVALSIRAAASRHPETHALVKCARRRILFIDIDRTDIPTLDSHAHEPAPETAPEQRRIDEQHLYLPTMAARTAGTSLSISSSVRKAWLRATDSRHNATTPPDEPVVPSGIDPEHRIIHKHITKNAPHAEP